MAENTFTLPWGNGELKLSLPGNWHIAGVLNPAALPGVADPPAETQRGLAEPIGMPRLRALARSDTRVALLVDDVSRPTPVAQLLPAVLDELRQAGVGKERITLVTAIGSHRAMTGAEVAARVGAGAFDGLHWESHDCDDPARLVNLGTTTRGTPVWLNSTVAGADLVVAIGPSCRI